MKMLRKYLSFQFTPLKVLTVLTIVKVVLILSFYQNIVEYHNGEPRLVRGYQWKEIVESMHEGKYEATIQTGLSDKYDMSTKNLRPPIYPIVLFLGSSLGKYSAVTLVLIHSIITSLIAYIGYKLVRLNSDQDKIAMLCMGALFIFPMNFLKSGAIDEAPLMLLFVLLFLYYLSRYIQDKTRTRLLIYAALFLGLSSMTRYITLPLAAGAILFLLAFRYLSVRNILVLTSIYVIVLSPWIARNYMVTGEFKFGGGDKRFFLITQSDEFIQSFPDVHVDVIERRYLRRLHESHNYLSELDKQSLNREFARLAKNEISSNPGKFIHSLLVKAKVFLPYKYFPTEKNRSVKSIIYAVPYLITLIFFSWAIISYRKLPFVARIILVLIVCYVTIAFTHFLLSRHFYPLIALMIIYSFIITSQRAGILTQPTSTTE